jgi:hypothetical protein
MMKKNILSIAIACLAMVSCTQGVFGSLNRPLADPIPDKPVVESFAAPNELRLSWLEDPRSDEFILERAVDSIPYSFNEVYRGKGTGYVDTHLGDEGTYYLYRLTKTRGTKIFSMEDDPSYWSMGVNISVQDDPFEPNDDATTTTTLTVDRIASTYYYLSSSGDEIKDVDWYRVIIPAHRNMSILITDASTPQGSAVGTHLLYQIPDGGEKGPDILNVEQNVEIAIWNTNDIEKGYALRVMPDPKRCVNDITKAGGMIVGYKISVKNIYKPGN